jgi:hypothetical protein
MHNEQKMILEMLYQQKISISQAEKLLDVYHHSCTKEDKITTKSLNKKFLKILVREGDTTKVNINVPLALAEIGLQLIPQEHLHINGKHINVDEILQLIEDGNEGQFVNIDAHHEGKLIEVKIFVE